MKNIRLFTKVVCSVVTLLLMLLPAGRGTAQNRIVDGKVTFKIEHKAMTLQEAQAALNDKTAIPLKVSLIFEGEWVDLFDKGLEASFRTSHLAFGIAQKDGRDETSAPLERTDPQAYIYARSVLNCTASDGVSLTAPSQPLDVCVRGSNLAWENTVCPTFAYGVQMSASNAIAQSASYLHKSDDGTYYELDLFYLYFRLKSLTTIYVRGIDYNSPAGDGLVYTDNESDVKPYTVGTTMLNLQTDDGTTISWPGGPTEGNSDWTLSGSTKYGQSGQSIETDYYGGIIPGGIFIEQVPELTQFEPSFEPGFNTAFCPGDKVTLTATVKYPSGSQRNQYHVALWAPGNHDAFVAGTSSLTPLVELNGNDANAIKDGYELSTTAAATAGGEVTYTITMTPEAFARISNSDAAGNTDYKKTFRIVVTEGAGAPTPSVKPVSKETVAQVANLPKLYLHVSSVYANTQGMQEDYDRTVAAGAYDVVSGMQQNTTVYLRYNCSYAASHPTWSSTCYYPHTADGVSAVSGAVVRQLANGVDKNANATSSTVRGELQLLSEPGTYYVRHNWNNGCVTETDTITITPTKPLAAPEFTITNYDCGTKAGTFEMFATSPDGVTPTDWQWVIRQELCDADGAYGWSPSCLESATSHDQDPLVQPTDNPDFGGGVVFDASHGFTKTSTMATTTWTISAVTNPGKTMAALTVTGGVTSPGSEWRFSNTLLGWWMPTPEIAPNQNACQTNYYWASAANKWVYVRYQTADGWSEWASGFTRVANPMDATPKGTSMSFGTAYSGKDFSISCGQSYVANIGGSNYTVQHPGPDFLSVPAADTAIIAGSPVQLYFTTNVDVDAGGKFTLLADLLWQVSTDGSTWTTWATTPAGTTVGNKTFITESGMMGVVEAPSLRYPVQEEQYRIVYNATCVIDPTTDGLTNYSKPLTVSMASNMEKGEIVAIVGGTPYTGSYLTLCDDKIDLMIRNQEPGATLQWEISADGSNWSTWSGKTADQVVFDLFPALNTIDKTVYDNGKSYWFRVLVTKDGETVKTVGYEVKKHYVLKPTLTAKTAKLTTSGICDGEKFEMTVGLAQMWLVANSYQLEAAPNGGNSFAGPVGTNTGYTASPVTLAYSVDGVISMNNANFRFKNTNDGCTAYSDTVQIKVVGKPTAGTISPTEFCPGQPVTMVYSGTNSNYYTWSYSDVGIGGMRRVADTSASILTMVIPETALYNNTVTMQVVPMNRRTAANLAGNGYDTTVCAIAAVSQSIKKANNCDVTLAANPITFCENDLRDVTLTMTPPQPATSGIQLQYKQGGSTYSNVPADKYTLNTATANGYETLTVDKAFFGTVTAGSTPVEFVVVVTPQGGSALSPSGAASVTVKATPVISRTTIAMNPTDGVCAGETLQIGSGASASVGTPTYKWIYAASAADVTNRVFADVPSGDGVHTGTTGNVLTLATTSSNRTTLNSRYYGLAVSATSDGCTAYDTTTFIQPIINPLPDTAAFIKSITADAVTDATKARHVTLSACSGTSITLSAVTDGTLKNGTLKHSDYTYEWYEGSTLLSNGVGGYAITNNADNTGTACVIPVSAATAGTKTYRLRVTAKASPDNGATYGCERGVVGTYTIVFANCGRDKLKDATAEHDKNTPYVVCESDNNWPIVDVEPATLPASGGGNAAVTAVTLYHRFGTSGTFTAVATKAAGQIPFDVKAAGTTHTQTGSHYYFAKVERTGYAPTYTDTAEYVIGALPESQLASAKVMAKATFTQGGTTTTVAGPTADLTVCAGLMLELSLDGMPADGTDAFASAGVPKANSYQWRKGTSATVPDAPTGTTVSGSSDINSLGAAAAGASGQSGYYYAYRIYERQTKINSTGAAKACSTTFKIPAAAKITVNPKPALPTAIASKTEEVCDGDEFDLTTTTTPAAAATGTTWTYRWYKKRGTGSTEIAYPAGGTGTLPNLNAIKVTADADGATAKVTDVYTLKIYGETAEGCVDSTAALSGITVNITPLPSLTAPTVTTTPAGGAVCEGTAATLSVPAVSVSGATVTYEWFKCASGTTQNPDTDNKVGTGTSYTTPATADAAGNYYVRITATPSGNAKCAATVLTANAAVTVNPLPQLGAAFTATTGGVAGYKTSVCKDEEPELTVTPDAALGYTYIYTWPTGAASASTTGGSTWKVAKTETAAAPATKTYSLKIKATTPAGCTKDTTLTFTVEVSACDKDAVQNGRDGTERDETHPFTVCAGEAAAAWPTVKIAAQNMAGRTIEKIELYHSYNSKADADFKLVKSSTPGTLTADLTFDPSTEPVSGIDLKQTGSHYYRAIVTRTGNNNNLRTSTVEYVVGAMPEPTVVAGASIMVSLAGTQAAALAAGDGNSLTMCAGPHAYLHLKDMPALPSGTTHTKYEWFKGTGSTVPADPAAAASAGATAIGTTATVDLGATGGITAQQTDYYYSYHTFARTTPINSTGANQTCDTVYRIGTAGVRIVNPMPVMPTKMDAQTIPVCDGATVNLAAKNIDNSPAAPSGTVWKYRWYKNGTAVSPAAGTLPAASDAYSFTASHGGTAGASNNQVVNDLYTLKVYAETAAGCADSALLNNAVSVQITPEPYADKPVVEAQGGGTGTDGKAYVCEGGTVTLRLKNDPLPNNGTGLAYQWYKIDGANRTALQNGDVYAGVALRNLTITGKKTDQSGMALAGEYVLVVTVKMNNPNCTAEVVSDVFELGFSERPEVRISAATDKAFTLCPNEETTLGVTLDDATKSEVADGTATVTYQWYKGGKTAAVAGATGATLDLNASDVGTPTSDKLEVSYYVKVTKKKVGFECPTEIWSDEAVATTGNGGMGEAFKVTVRKECGKDEIVDADAPTVALTSGVATAICSAEADPGKTFMLKADGDRLAVSKATWYYAPVTEDASGKLVMGTVSKGKECTNIATGATGCPFATKTEGGMLAAGEWRLWVDVERDGANMRTTDTIHFVIRPNPTLTNDPKAIMTKKGEAAEVSDHLVCQGTEIDLKLNEAAVLNTLSDSKDKTETRKETITYSWVCTNCGNTTERVATPVYSFTTPLDRQSVTSSDAPASARYEGNYALKQTYTRAYQRTGAPTYNITCPVVDAAKKPLEKQFPVKVFTSIEPKGSLADASGATSKAYCTDDLTTGASLELVFAPQTSGADATPQAKVTVWEYNVDGGAWQTWTTVATGATTPNSLTVDLTDSKLVRPAAGAVKTYNFRAQAANGPCDKEIGTYTLSLYGALTAGTLTVPDAVCADASNTSISVTAAGFAPADATVHFALYASDPTPGNVSELVGGDVTGSGASASKTFGLTTTPTVPTKYYVRYQVKNPVAASPCDEVYSTVEEVTVYPSGEISHTGSNGLEVCFEDGTEVTFPLTQKNTTGFDVYAFDAPKTEADLKSAVISGSVTPVASGTGSDNSVTITYDKSASTPAMYQTQTYYYFVAKTGMYAVDKNAACALSIAQTNIKTVNPLSAAVLAWDNPQSPSTATDLIIDKGRSNKITLTGGEHQRVDRAEIAATLHYAPDDGSGNPDKLKEQTRSNFTSGYSYQFTTEGVWHFWVVVDGTPCDDVTSNTIKATVNPSSELLLTGEQDICSDGDIELAVEVDGDNTKDVVASSVKWSYGSSETGPWTQLSAGTSAGGTVTIAGASPFTMTWTGHGFGQSAESAYHFKMTYSTTGGSDKETPPYKVTVHPKPSLSSLDALNLPAATCDQTAFDIKLKTGVTATSASIAGIKWTLQFTQQDPASAAEGDWTAKSRDAGGDVLHHALNLTDSGYYRLRIEGNAVCPSVTSNAALLTVNSKPEAGTLSMDPATACYNGDAEIKLTGYAGKITGYEYHPLRERADQVSIGDTVWKSVLEPSTAFPLNLSGLSNPMPAAGYPDTWTWKNATHGYSLRAIVSNGACTPAVTSMKIQIYDTIAVSLNPVDCPVLVDEDGYPTENVKFTAKAVTAGLKYVNGSALTPWPDAQLVYQWRVSFDDGATWRNVEGAVENAGTASVTVKPDYFKAVVNGGLITESSLNKIRFRCLVTTPTGSACKHDVRTTAAGFVPQTTLHAGTVESEGTASGCFYYGDTMVLFHDGAVGHGDIVHYWMINKVGSGSHHTDNLESLDNAGIKYRYGTDAAGNEDRRRIYISTSEKSMAYWAGKVIHVFVTDDKHTSADWFDTNGGAVESLFAEWDVCLRNKPVWTMANDTVCDTDESAVFTMEPGTDLSGVTITTMLFDVRPVGKIRTPDIVSKKESGSKWTGSCSYDDNAAPAKTWVLDAELDQPTARTLTLKHRAADQRFHELYDSMEIRAVVGTDCSRQLDTVFALLRIDRGVKAITPVKTELAVCEGGTVDLEAAIERFSTTIPSEISWKWQRRGTSGDASTDTDAGEANKFTGKTTQGVPDPVKLTLNPVAPKDSGIWVLKTETACGVAKEQEFNLKVDVKPTWQNDLTVADNDICAGKSALALAATLNVNWQPDIQWERSQTGADGSWTKLVADGTMTVKADYTPGQAALSLGIDPTYQSDSGYYRIAVTAPVGSACAGFTLYSAIKYVHIDTTPQITLSREKWELSSGTVSSALTATVSNPKPEEGSGASCEQKPAQWRVLYADNLADGAAYNESVSLEDFKKTAEGQAFVNNITPTEKGDGSGYTLTLSDVPLALDGISVFLRVENCCGVTNSDTVLIRVQDALALDATQNDTVCEGTAAHLKATANMNIDDASKRAWEYTTGADDDNWQPVPMTAWNATEDMNNSVAVLTIPNVPYSMDGYRFRFKVTEGGVKYSDPAGTLVVRPVDNLHVLVTANPNPASDYKGIDMTNLNALVYVGDVPKEDGSLPDNAKILTDEELTKYGYTVFDWYQIAPGKPSDPSQLTVNLPNSGIFETTGDIHGKVYELQKLSYDDHDSTRYFTILRSDCFEAADHANQQDGGKYEGLYSDTAVLRIYEDLLLEWHADYMYTEDTLPYGTLATDLDTMFLPTDEVIGVDLETEDPSAKHQISSAYYLKCGSDDAYTLLNVELRKGVQSEVEALVIATRQWHYRKSPDDEWHAIAADKLYGGDEDPDFGEIFDMKPSRRELEIIGLSYAMNGWQFRSVALADSTDKDADGHAIYRYRDTTPILTLVVSEPLPEDLAFVPDSRDDEPCRGHDYKFELNTTHESYRYEWKIKRPGDADYMAVDSLKGKSAFFYGPATPAEDGTMIRAIVSNYCGKDSVEAELRVMTVDISPDTLNLCADETYELTATPHNAGGNPTYTWLVDGTEVPGATGATFVFDPATAPAREDGKHAVDVRVTASEELTFVNPMACNSALVTVRPLPSNGQLNLKAEPSTVTIVDSATLSISNLEPNCTVVWSPAEWLYDPTAAETSTRPIPQSGSHWFYATVTNEYGCTVTDSVELTVSSSFTLDSTGAVVVVPPLLPWLDADGNETADTTLQIVVIGDTLCITACENSIAFVTLFSSGGDPTLVYEWEGIEPLTAEELADYGYAAPLPDSVFALFLDGEITECGCTITERDGEGLTVHAQIYVAYYNTQHVALEAIPHMRHNRYYENQVVFFTAHPNRFSWYHFYDYNPADDGNEVPSQHGGKNLYKTDYIYTEGADRTVYVSVADANGCRSYDSVDVTVLPLPNAMVLNDPNYPEADILFPEFEVEIHDSWGRLVKAMDDGLGWDARRGGKQVEGGTYYYRVKLPTIDGFTYVKGAVTVFTKKK